MFDITNKNNFNSNKGNFDFDFTKDRFKGRAYEGRCREMREQSRKIRLYMFLESEPENDRYTRTSGELRKEALKGEEEIRVEDIDNPGVWLDGRDLDPKDNHPFIYFQSEVYLNHWRPVMYTYPGIEDFYNFESAG